MLRLKNKTVAKNLGEIAARGEFRQMGKGNDEIFVNFFT